MVADLLGEFLGGVVAGAALAVVHGGHLQDHGKIPARGDGDGVQGELDAQQLIEMLLQAQPVHAGLLAGVPGGDVHHQVDGGGVLDGTGAEELGHVDDADAPQLDVIADQGRGTAHQGGGADPLDFHGIVGDEPVATLDQLHGGLALANAALAGQQHALAVNLHQNAVAGDPGSQLPGQVGDDGGDDGAGGAGPAEDGDVVLLGHLQAFGAGDQAPGCNEGGDLVAEEPVIDHQPLGGIHLVEIARLHIADDLQAHGLEMVEISGDLQARTGHIRHGDLDLVVIRGTPGHLQIKLGDHLGKGNRVGFGHFATSEVHNDNIIQRSGRNGNPKKIFRKF